MASSKYNGGRLVVDFAGSEAEARAFADQHGFQVAKPGKGYSSDELPSLTLPFNSRAELLAGQDKLKSLGWESGSYSIHWGNSNG